MEVRINKEVRNYQESLFFGLSLRQFLFALLAVLVALAVYFCLHPVLGTGEIGWVCILAAFPFALGGFFTYNGMTLSHGVYPLGIFHAQTSLVPFKRSLCPTHGTFIDKGGHST